MIQRPAAPDPASLAASPAEGPLLPSLEFDLSLISEVGREVLSISKTNKDFDEVASRVLDEVNRIRLYSGHLQEVGNVYSLIHGRWARIGSFYNMGNEKYQLKAIVSVIRRASYSTFSRLGLGNQRILEEQADFVSEFLIECLTTFRREFNTAWNYRPSSRIEHAEFYSFVKGYCNRNISNAHLVNRRAQTFIDRKVSVLQEIPASTALEGEADDSSSSSDRSKIRDALIRITDPSEELREQDRGQIVDEVIEYLHSRGQGPAADLFCLKVRDIPQAEIDIILDLTPRARDLLQQKLMYHLTKLIESGSTLSQDVQSYIGIGIEERFGLLPSVFRDFVGSLPEEQQALIRELSKYQPEEAFRHLQNNYQIPFGKAKKLYAEVQERARNLRKNSQSEPNPGTYESLGSE